eukprot:403356519
MRDNNLILLEEDEGDTRNNQGGKLDSRSFNKNNKLEEKIKFNLFNIFFALLKGINMAPWKIYVLLVIEFIQFLSFPFHPSLINQWKNYDVMDSVTIGFQTFGIKHWLWYADVAYGDYLICFYIMIVIVFLIIVDFIYVSFAVNNQKHSLSFSWPLSILQYFSLILIRVLFQPILELLLSMVSCEMKSQAYLQTLNMEMQLDPNGPDLLVMQLYNNVQLFAFLNDQSFSTFKILILAVFSTMTYTKYYYQRPYYNRSVNNVMCVLYGIFAWTTYMILLGAILSNTMFDMLLVIYLLGIPIVIALIMTMENQGMKILLSPLYKFQKGEDALQQFNQLIYLIETKDTIRESSILIKGFVNYHEMSCVDDDCSLKQYQKNLQRSNQLGGGRITNINKMKNSQNNNSQNNFGSGSSQKILQNESNSLLLNFTKKLLEKSIRKFPQYKKLIGDSLMESGKESGGFEYVSAVNFESNYRKCKTNIERSALLHYELWNHLLEDSPDLGRLSDIGFRIDHQLKQVEYHWNQMQMIYPNTPKALKLYAQFQIEVLNDKEGGNELLLKAKESSQIKSNFDIGGNADDIIVGGMGLNQQDGSPLIYLSGENDRLGLISNLNLSACRVFGYLRKEELINKNIKVLQPGIYSFYHDEFIRSALLKSSEQMTNKERSIYGKHISGYIFPLSLQIKFFQSFLHGKQFVATLKQEKKGINASVAYIVMDKNGVVLDVTSSAIQLLDIDKQKMVKKRIKYDLNVLLPQIFEGDQQRYYGKQGEKVTYYYPDVIENQEKVKQNEQMQEENKSDNSYTSMEDDGDNSQNGGDLNKNKSAFFQEESDKEGNLVKNNSAMELFEDNNIECNVKASDKSAPFHCNIFPIQFQSINNNETQGYSVRLELISDDENGIQQNEGFNINKARHKERIKKMVKMSDFQFSFSPIYKKFVRELRDDENADSLLDIYYKHVQKENIKRGDDQQKLTVMSYMNQVKAKMEKMEENKNAAMMGDDYIREVDEYSEETHSDDGFNGRRRRGGKDQTNSMKSHETIDDSKKGSESEGLTQEQQRNMQKRINQLLYQKGNLGGQDTAERLIEKIQEITEILKHKAKCAEDVLTYRVFEGEVSLVEEITGNFLINKSAETTQAETEEVEDAEKKNEKIDDFFKNSLKSRKAFQSQLNDKGVLPAVKNIQYSANFVLLIFIALVIIEYVTVRNQFTTIQLNFQAIQKTYSLISELQRSSYHVRGLELYSSKQLNLTAQDLNLSKSDMKESLNRIYSLQSQINLQKLTVSAEHAAILDSKTVTMYFKQQDNISDIKELNFSLTEGLLQISSSLFTLTNLDNNMFIDTQDDVFYFMYNNFMDMLLALWRSAYLYVDELKVRTVDDEVNQIVFYCSIALALLCVFALIPVVQYVNIKKRKYLEIFLEMDNTNIRKLANKCEKFMNVLQDEGNEEIDSNDEELEEMARIDSEEEYSLSKRSKKKKAKNTIKNNRIFIIKFVIGMMFIEVYFFSLFFTQGTSMKTFEVVNKEMNTTAMIEPYYWLSLNAQREMYNDKSRPILKKNSFLVSRDALANVQHSNQEMQQEHLQNKAYTDEDYNSIFQDSMLLNVCPTVSPLFTQVSGQQCSSFVSGSTTQGLHTVIVRYEEGLRRCLQNYQKSNKTLPEINKILNSQDIREVFLIQRFILSQKMQAIVQTLQDTIQTNINSTLELRLAFFCLFIIFLLMFFVLLWLPFVNQLTNEVYQTKKILLVIPLELLVNMKSLANLFSQQGGSKSKAKKQEIV